MLTPKQLLAMLIGLLVLSFIAGGIIGFQYGYETRDRQVEANVIKFWKEKYDR